MSDSREIFSVVRQMTLSRLYKFREELHPSMTILKSFVEKRINLLEQVKEKLNKCSKCSENVSQQLKDLVNG